MPLTLPCIFHREWRQKINKRMNGVLLSANVLNPLTAERRIHFEEKVSNVINIGLNSGIFLHKVVKIKFFFLSFVNSKQFKYFKTDFQGIIIIVEPAFIWFKNKTGSILGTFPEIPLMWGPQTTFQ